MTPVKTKYMYFTGQNKQVQSVVIDKISGYIMFDGDAVIEKRKRINNSTSKTTQTPNKTRYIEGYVVI